MIRIDPHVHCRDWSQSYKETIAHALLVAKDNGLSAIFDMPNTNPPITTEEHVKKRFELVPVDSPVWYGLYIGVTADREQVEEAARIVATHPHVVGMKMYAGHSTGDLAVINEVHQRNVFKILADVGYKGVLFVHCEKESFMHPEKWDPTDPYTHVLNRTLEAEVESVKDMILFARETGFQGKLYLGHLSTPQAIDLITEAKTVLNIFSGTTFQHLILHAELLKEKQGLVRKVNPSLKPLAVVEELRKQVREGKVDCLETDHAPHTLKEKLEHPHASGFPGLPVYHKALTYLNEKLDIDQDILDRMTSTNVIKLFGLEDISFNENSPREVDYAGDYEYDAYDGIL